MPRFSPAGVIGELIAFEVGAPGFLPRGVARKSRPLLLEGDPPTTAGEVDPTFNRRQLCQALVCLGYFE
jgi:hypothetical protein